MNSSNKTFISFIIILAVLSFNIQPSYPKASTSDHKISQTTDTEKENNLKIIPIVNLDLFGTYSKIQGHEAVEGGLLDLTISPAVKLNKDNYLIPMYNINYNKERQVISEEEGGRLTKETLTHNIFLTYKRQVNDKLTAKFSGLGTLSYYKETANEDWSEGLYDYIDKGGLLDLEYTLSHPKAKIYKEAGFEAEYYRRMYTNFHSLISLATVTAPEEHTKNYDGIKFSFSYLRQNPDGLSLKSEYTPLLKYFTDKKVIGSDGVLDTSTKRDDNQHALDLFLSYPVTKRLTAGLNGGLLILRSNQNYYDSRGTAGLADDVFTEDYYDYNQFKIKPTLTYDMPVKKGKDLTVSLSYSYKDRCYTNRKAQTSDSTYTDNDQEDEYHTITLGFSYPLTEKIDARFIVNYVDADSNMKYERYYKYNYDLLSFATGISCRF
jgi:hypothetical protein